MISRMRTLLKQASLFSLAVVLAVTLIPIGPLSSVSAQEQQEACDELYYSDNDILYYNPCLTECSPSGSSSDLQGVDNIEKIWNFYAAKGLKPVAIAGIMGNYSQESTFDPAVKQDHTLAAIPLSGDGKTGYGLAQWTYRKRQAGLFAKMQEAGVSQYLGAGWGASEKNKEIPPADIDKLLEVQLNYSWDGDTTTIASFADEINALTSVESNNGSATFFHNRYEGSSDTAAQIEERVADAVTLLNRLGGTTTTTGDSCAAATSLGGVTKLEDAVAWAERYVSDTKAEYEGTSVDPSGTDMNEGENPKFVYNFGHGSGAYCWNAADCGQCVALSGWFVRKMTTEGTFRFDNGGYIVDKYEAAGHPTGRDPKPFSIFSAKSSEAGHTGLILGVLANGEVITAETNWDSNGSVVVWQGDIKRRYAGKDLKFAYFDDRLAGDAAAAMASASGSSTTTTAPASESVRAQ